MRFGKTLSIVSVHFLVAILYLGGCSHPKETISAEEFVVPLDSSDVSDIIETPTDWVEDQLSEMTLDEKIAQLFMVRAVGYYYPDESDQFERILREVKEKKYGGICLFQGDIYSSAVLLNRLQQASKVPLLVSADFEWGLPMRTRRSTRFPEAMAAGATRDTLLAFKMGMAVGREARAIGVHQVYAPVADVNVNPDNPVINTRSFGEQPRLVADMAVAYARGLQAGGVIATAKHFPGHGDTDVDSHLGLPVIPHSRGQLDTVEIYPFRRLIERGVSSVMIAHFRIPAFETTTQQHPASLSPLVVNGLLLGELGFQGLVVTDALEMGALARNYGADSTAILAIEAGVDILLLSPDDQAAFEAVRRAVLRGRISEARIDHSVRKILAMKQWLGLDENRTVDVEKIPSIVSNPRHRKIALDIARESITLLKNDGMVPLPRSKKRILHVVVSDVDEYRTEINRVESGSPNERAGDYFASLLRRRGRGIATVRLDPSTNAMAADSIVRLAARADMVVLSVFSKARSASGKFGLPQPIIDNINRVIMLGKPAMMIAFGSPYVIRSFPNLQGYICSYSDSEPTSEATAEVLFGEIPTQGRLPVTIPGMFRYGEGILTPQLALRRDLPEAVGFNPDSLALVDSVMERALSAKAFPGAQLAIAKDEALVVSRPYGTLDYLPSARPVLNETMFDIASLTKVIATTPSIMRLYDDGKISLDDPVVKYIPRFGVKGKEGVTIRNLLMHNAGLPAFKELYKTAKSPQEVLDSVLSSELIYRPGDSTVYSDFGFITLGKIVEAVSGMRLDSFAMQTFYDPLGMTRTMFNPPESLWTNIAATESDSVWQRKMFYGVVHDENAYALGGIAGHAGLFSTASDLAIFTQMILNGGIYDGKRYFKEETVRLFTTRQLPQDTRSLGWDLKSASGYSSAGKYFSPNSFGHLGFTGTSIWVDTDRKIFVILLTNRVHPTRKNIKIREVRPAVHDAVIRALKNPQFLSPVGSRE